MAKRKKKTKVWDYVYAVVTLTLMIAILVISILLLTHVQKITVTGTKYSESSSIIGWIKEDKYTSNSLYALWKFKSGRYELPVYLEQAKVGIRSPWELTVQVTEKQIVGCILVNDSYAYIDKEGLVIEKGTSLLEDIPVIEGLQVSNVKKHQKLKMEDEKLFRYIVNVTKEVRKNELKPDRLVWEEDSMNLYFAEICVKLGKSNFADKLLQVPPILQKLEGKSGILHLEHYNQMSTSISFEQNIEENK